MRRVLAICFLGCACAGCLTSAPPRPTSWVVDASPNATRATAPAPGAFAVTRQGGVTVSAPFDRTTFVVRRANGSVALDAYNVFAAPPATMLRTPVRARLEADGRFGRVVPQTSVAAADVQVEVLVRDLSLDCTESGGRRARSAVSVDVVHLGRGTRTVVLSGDGAGEADAASGDYSAAFTAAFDAAMGNALRDLREQPPPQLIEPNTKEPNTKGDRK